MSSEILAPVCSPRVTRPTANKHQGLQLHYVNTHRARIIFVRRVDYIRSGRRSLTRNVHILSRVVELLFLAQQPSLCSLRVCFSWVYIMESNKSTRAVSCLQLKNAPAFFSPIFWMRARSRKLILRCARVTKKRVKGLLLRAVLFASAPSPALRHN